MFELRFQDQDLTTPRLREILARLSPTQRKSMLTRLAKQLEKDLKAHFTKRDQEGNKRGFPRQHFWAREVRTKTAFREATADRAVVGINSAAFRQKLHGGVIRPGPGRRYLAIPTRPEAYGVLPRAGTIPGLFARRIAATGKLYLAVREGSALRVYWRLVPSVNQRPDPNALPPLDVLQRNLEARAAEEIQRIVSP